MDQGFFLAISGLGVSLAGFAGLIHALDNSPGADNPVSKWRIRNIVTDGFGLALAGVLVVPVYSLSEDTQLTVRVVSSFMLLYFVAESVRALQPGPAWKSEALRRRVITIRILIGALLLVSIVLGSVGFLQLMFFLNLIGPMGTFVRALNDLRIGRSLRNGD